MSRFIDERGRIFGRVNIVDILVLLVIVAIVVFAVLRLVGGGSEAVTVTVTCTVERIRDYRVEGIRNEAEKKGAVEDDRGTPLGEIVAVSEPRPSEVEFSAPTVDENGKEGRWTLQKDGSPIFKDLDIVIRGDGTLDDDGSLYIGDMKLRRGMAITLRGPNFEVPVTVMSWEEAAVVSREE
ncbi:MAG: DUF4330 domain-containing protein [Thermoleophilia bacterium]